MPRDTDDQALVAPWPALALWLVEQAEARGTLLFIARSEARLDQLAGAAPIFAGGRVEVLALPPWDTLPYDRIPPSAGVVGCRVRALSALAHPAERPRLVLTCADAVLQRVRPPGAWKDAELVLSQGEALHLDALRAALAKRGYHHLDERVDEPGEVAIRGQTIDVFPAGQPRPVRLSVEPADGSDGHIAALHAFDPATQRSTDEVDRVVLHPAVEFPLHAEAVEDAAEALAQPDGPDPAAEDPSPFLPSPPRLVPLFDYLPDAAAMMLDDAVEERWHAFREQIEDGFAATSKAHRAGSGGVLPRPSRFYLTPEQAWAAVADRLLPVDAPGTPVKPPRRVDALLDLARTAAERGDRVAIATPEAPERVAASLARRGLQTEAAPGWDALQPGRPAALALDLPMGFSRPGLLVLSAAGLLRAPPASRGIVSDEAPRAGDIVVHLDHGVTRLERLAEVQTDGQAEERIALRFADGAELLAPAGELDRIWRYGADVGAVSLDRMGGETWRARRAEIEAEVAGTARGLAEAAARRAARKAPVIEPPQPACDRLARRFPYGLSLDQRAAVDATLADLAAERPMNRLICGDVGFGKTEVALRAAAAAALAGWQVAIVAPTTVLARQHLQTVRRRFADIDVRVAGLIRGADTPEGRAVRRGLSDGSVRVVVGTHGLASGRVRFARLGLVVVDEKQRFGDAHKARFSDLAGGEPVAHVLAMTATPIPRTLQEALVGLRDVSVIATAPVRRQPTRTFMLPFDPVVAREALMREHRRGGQSFVVCPRIGDLAPTEARLREAAPELRVVQAHGRMKPEALDDAVTGFAEGEGDVLLATTIIEAGLDIPRANTMLVMGADRFGLAQLHQLRGRVGRGQRRGAAYFMTEPDRHLGAVAVQRLRTMEAMASLGAGMAISAADLDQRGAGDLFGEKQAGHVRAVGTELYQHLLARASAGLRGEAPPPPPPELHVGLTGRIPADHVPETDLRLSLYRRLARMADPAELAEFEDEMADRFGPVPPELAALFALSRLRLHCTRAGLARLDAGPQAAALTPCDPADVQRLGDTLGGRVRDGRVILDIAEPRAEARVERLIAKLSPG